MIHAQLLSKHPIVLFKLEKYVTAISLEMFTVIQVVKKKIIQ